MNGLLDAKCIDHKYQKPSERVRKTASLMAVGNSLTVLVDRKTI